MKRLVWIVCAGACSGSSPALVDGSTQGSDGGDGSVPVDAAPAHLVAYVSGYGPNIARFDVASATGALAAGDTVTAFAANPSFLAVDPTARYLYAVSESTSQVGSYTIDSTTGTLAFVNARASGGNGPAHVSVDRGGKFVLVANYGDGHVVVYPIQAGGGLGAASQTLLAGTNAHEMVTDPSNKFAFVPCLGSDYVAQYTFDPATGTLAPNAVPHFATAAGAGPRHIAFSPDGKFAYLLAEKASTVSALALDTATGRLSQLQTVSTLPTGFSGTNTGAEVWVHPGGEFVFTSNRGDDSIATFRRETTTGHLTLVGHTKTGGMTPRDFTLDPSGHFLYAANQNSGTVTTFAFDSTSGALTRVGSAVNATSPSFVGIIPLP